ncbi:MAG: peptide deformylase [Bacteroidales bacterium]|jgi:peptide deformylase|nr:peptide deformylase [Bacteroidales bacterium]
MKTANDILLIGDPKLNKISAPFIKTDLKNLNQWVSDLSSAMEDVRAKYNFGRGIAAPQLGILKRLIYLNLEKPYIIINPEIIDKSHEMITLWDDCMSFPNLLVKVKRHKKILFKYLDENWEQKEWFVEDDLSELFQHEYDHLDGVLSTERAIDAKSFKWRKL